MKIQTEKIPKLLYKYRTLNDFTKLMLSKGEIYFATTNELQDPLEKCFRQKNGAYINNENNKSVYLNHESYTNHKLNTVRKGGNEPYGILSLCKSRNEIRMYKEYADDFKGICIGFDWKKFGLFFAGSYPPEKNIPREVIYQDIIEIEEEHISSEKWIEILTTKTPGFAHEKEYRMFYTKGKLSSDNIRYAIKEIIFGHNLSKEDILMVRELINDLNDIDLFITTPVIEGFGLQIFPYTEKNQMPSIKKTNLSNLNNQVYDEN